jgi:hypothetical protein
LANALHLLPHRGTAHDAVGVKLYAHRLGVEFIEIHLHFKYVPVAVSLKFHFAEAKYSPFLVQSVPPIDYLFADCALVGSPLTVG